MRQFAAIRKITMELPHASSGASPERVLIDDILLDAGQRKLWRGSHALSVTRLTFDLLLTLVRQAPNVVTHNELIERVWGPRRVVSAETLSQCVLRLRHALGDDAVNPRYIESIRGHGYRLIPAAQPVFDTGEQPAVEAAATGRVPLLRPRRVAAGLAVLSLLVALGIFELGRTTREPVAVAGIAQEMSAAFAPQPRAIAVLPFATPEMTASDAVIADGIHADILNELARISDLSVIARATMARFADTSLTIPEIATDLDVEFVMQLEISLSDQRLKLTAELIDGRTGTQDWFGRYDEHLSEISGVQRELVASVARELGARLSDAEMARLQARPTTSAEAYEFFLAAADSFDIDPSDSTMIARTYLDKAIALDPEFARAYGFKGLIYAYSIDEYTSSGGDYTTVYEERARLAETYAAAALELDPGTVIAHRARANAAMRSWHLNTAKRAFEAALMLSPNDVVTLSEYAFFSACAMGEQESLRHARRALELDPKNPRVYELLGRSLTCTGDREAGLAALRQSVQLDPTSFRRRAISAYSAAGVVPANEVARELQALEPMLAEVRLQAYPAIALTYRQIGHDADAARIISEFEAFDGYRMTNAGNSVFAYLAVGDDESAYRTLERAVQRLGPGSGYLTLLTIRNNLRRIPELDEPRFVGLRGRIRALD